MRRNPPTLVLVGLFFIWILPSCAIFQTEPAGFPKTKNKQDLAAVEVWRMEGRIGVISKYDSWHASLVWDHKNDADLLYISGPFGQGALNIKVTDRYMRVVSSDGSVKKSENPEKLLKSELGVAVPVRALRYWIMGLPYPSGVSETVYDRLGRLITLNQLGWEINYRDYEKNGNWTIPVKISVLRKDIKLKLVVDQWEIPNQTE